jgi:hypothetical protein
VTEPFSHYQIGDIIENEVLEAQILNSYSKRFVVPFSDRRHQNQRPFVGSLSIQFYEVKTMQSRVIAASLFQTAFSDVNDSPANSLLAVKIVTLPSVGELKLDGAAITAGQFVPVTDIAANKLTFEQPANVNGTYTFTFALQDDGGTANGGIDLSADATFTIDITPVNSAPTAADITLTVDEVEA